MKTPPSRSGVTFLMITCQGSIFWNYSHIYKIKRTKLMSTVDALGSSNALKPLTFKQPFTIMKNLPTT